MQYDNESTEEKTGRAVNVKEPKREKHMQYSNTVTRSVYLVSINLKSIVWCNMIAV